MSTGVARQRAVVILATLVAFEVLHRLKFAIADVAPRARGWTVDRIAVAPRPAMIAQHCQAVATHATGLAHVPLLGDALGNPALLPLLRARAAVGRMCPIRMAGGAVYRRAGSSGGSSRPRLAEPAEPGVAGPLPLRKRGGLDAAAAESAVAGTEDDVEAAAGDARAAGVTRVSAVARAAGARAVAAEEIRAPANASIFGT